MLPRSAALSVALLLSACCNIGRAGILISRADKGLQFVEAASLTINGKDKVLSLGSQPALSGPIGKLKEIHLTGSLLTDTASKAVALYEPAGFEYILPQNLPKNSPTGVSAIWQAAHIAYKKTASDKAPSEIPVASFIGFLAGGAEELTKLCMDQPALELIGGKKNAFPTQLEWIAAVVKTYGTNPAMAPLEKYLSDAMRSRYTQFEGGTADLNVLAQGLKLAELSQTIYPNQPEQTQLRQSLQNRKTWLDRKIGVLNAFAAAKEWDAMLLGARDFEKYQRAFPEIWKRHTEALKQSLVLHREAGERHLKDSEFGAAYRQFHLASMRQPSDSVMQQRVLMAWTEYSRQMAIDQQRKRKQVSAGERAAIDQAMRFADGYREQNKLDLALKKVLEAEQIDRNSLKVILKKAEILGAQRAYTQALAALDQFDFLSVDDERKPAADLRSDLLFKRTSMLEDLKTQVKKAWTEQRFHRALDLSLEGLRGKDDDADLLFNGGMAALAVRDSQQGRALLNRYLDISQTLDADQAQRARVRSVLAATGGFIATDQGNRNWLSGERLAKGTFYSPISMAFQPRVDRIDASNKLKVAFEWDGDRLKAIIPSFEKNERVTSEKKISFGYEDRVPQVISIALDEAQPPPTPPDADDRFNRSNLVVLNNPYVDPAAIQKLTGKNVTVGIAGNRFFNPFVWEKVYYFRFTYDEAGRVSQAREIADPKTGAGGVRVEFEWRGTQLAAIRGYQGDDPKVPKIYERIMQYLDGQLTSEDIQSQGKSSRIKYAYTGGRLVSAEGTQDPSVDGRSRKVTFLASSPTTLVK